MLVRLKECEGESESARYCEGDSRIISTGDVTAHFQFFSGSQLLSDFQTFFYTLSCEWVHRAGSQVIIGIVQVSVFVW